MLSLLSPEQRVPARHPLRAIKVLADTALRDLSPVFDAMYSVVGRPSIPPERLPSHLFNGALLNREEVAVDGSLLRPRTLLDLHGQIPGATL